MEYIPDKEQVNNNYLYLIVIIIIILICLIYFFINNLEKNNFKICFAIPTTSNKRNWNKIEDSYLYNSIKKLYKNYSDIYIYISYDKNDPLFSSINNQMKLNNDYNNFNIKWFENDFEPGNVVKHWNYLYKKSYKNNIDYTFLIGDDIEYPDNNNWLNELILPLKNNNDIGISGGFSGQKFMTQFLVSKKHYEIFNYAFNPNIKNWYCDNYLFELYPKKYINFLTHINLPNKGGPPRYNIINMEKIYKNFVNKDKIKLDNYLSKI